MANKRSSSLEISSPYPQCRTILDHHGEERGALLTSSETNDDLSSPTAANSETDASSSSATLAESQHTAQRIRLGGTPAVIAGLLFGAALTAVLHHVYLFILQGRTVSSQFWIKNSSNALSTLVQWLCMGSVSVSLTQLIWYLLRRRPFTILQLNHLFGLPDPLRILRLASSRRFRNAISVIVIATLLQAFALVSILAPNSLEVGSASPQNTIISVPTILFNEPDVSGFQCSVEPTAVWQKVMARALQSDTLIGWNAPAGCGTACNYTIQYPAPALRCTELDMDEVNTMLPILDTYDRIVYNSTATWPGFTGPMSMAWRTYDVNGISTNAGTRCWLYNTTQQSVVSFINNTAMISPSIISYDSPVNTDPAAAPEACPGPGSSNVSSLSFYIYAVVGSWLFRQLEGALVRQMEDSDGTHAYWHTSIDSPFNLATNNLFSLNETAGTFTPKSDNVSSELEQILVNVTVALISSMGHTTAVNASVTQDQLIWVYHFQRLWIVYATALVVTAACGAIALACMLKDGEDSELTFWDIVRATRNSELDALVEGEKRGNPGKDTMLQYAVQGRDSDTNTSGVFVLARSRHKRLSWMNMGS